MALFRNLFIERP